MSTALQSAQADELKAFLNRIDNLEDEKAATAADIRDIYAQAKAKGYDVKAMRKVVSRRRKDRKKVEEEDQIVELYEGATQ